MKNLKCFPFERNRYFYGKLLSVSDFETEQKYFNDKRRTINRFLFGSGVVCGLSVVEADEETITIERGLALDFSGREIVVDEPVIKRLDELEGFDREDAVDGGYYYLCLEYREEATELMHSIAGAVDKNSGEYNKYKEGYRLFVTQLEPERQIYSPSQIYEDAKTVYNDQGVKITQILPRYIEMGSDVLLRVEIENTGQQEAFSFEYELALSFMTYHEETSVRICFDEKDHAKDRKYVLEIPLKAAFINNVKAEAALAQGSFVLRAGGREYSTASHCTSEAMTGNRSSYEELKESYYKGAMDYIANDTFQQSIYLAKIYVVKAGGTCLIDRLDLLPFDQQILHTEISTAFLKMLADDVGKLKEQEKGAKKTESLASGVKAAPLRIASGEITLSLENVRQGQSIVSPEIFHGLGFGSVSVILGYEEGDDLLDEKEIYCGDASVFENREVELEASLGAKIRPSEGSFMIGAKILKKDGAEHIRIHWTAVRDEADRTEEQRKKHLYIQPDIPNLNLGESVVFTAVMEGFRDDRLVWNVKDTDGGTIGRNGTYTAPQTPGVYHITVSSMAYPDIKASTFAVVREKKDE